MNSFREIIDHFGNAKFAQLIDVEVNHVRTMKTRNSVPAEYWGLIIAALPELTFEKLRSMRDERFAKQVAA